MQRKILDVWVGLFVLLGAAALVFLALKAGNMSSLSLSQRTYAVTAKFDNIGGLTARAANGAHRASIGSARPCSSR